METLEDEPDPPAMGVQPAAFERRSVDLDDAVVGQVHAADDGNVTKSLVSQASRPDKTRYTLSPAGLRELEGWATSAWVRTSGFRDELFLKLFGAARLGPESLAAFVATQRQTYLSELGGLTRRRREHSTDPMIALLIDAAIAHTKADLELLDTAPSRLAAAVRAAASIEMEVRPAGSG